MSAPPFLSTSIPPLPPGWTQHTGPASQIYYHNAQTRESTYIRPLPSFKPQIQPEDPPKKKEKAHGKTPIPGTDWLRITTTEGNVFYSNRLTKQSSWTVPPEIADAAHALEIQEKKPVQVPPESQSERKNKVVKEGKRKRDEVLTIDEVVSKKVKIDEEGNEEGTSSEEESEEEEEEEWQREAAEQLAREAEEERIRKEEEAKQVEDEAKSRMEEAQKAKAEGGMVLNMPERVDLSVEEAKALFKTLLQEKDINPLHPWDLCLPKFISDPRYVLLPSVTARKEAFDEYCRERARELRETTVKKERQGAHPKDDFDKLLKDEVKSTRTSWTDFRRTWKKDRRFYGWGRDDKERERAFRDYLKALGEKKKAAAQKAEADFFALLKEHSEIKPGVVWKEVKRALYDDSRYDAVGSSSLREELFGTYIKGIGTLKMSEDAAKDGNEGDTSIPETESKEARRERALREREQKVEAEKGMVNMSIAKSRTGMNHEEGERLFKTMLVDAIRDPQTNWDTAISQLKIDPRFINSPLPSNHQVKLFHSHITHLRSKHLDALHSSLQEKTPSLNSKFSDLPVHELLSSFHATRLGYDIHQLADEFDRWQRQRYIEARAGFDEMLGENSFVEFWGRLSKMSDTKLDQGLQITTDDLGEDDDAANKIDMKALAKTVDIGEMIKVLKRDKRYVVFDHIPEQREAWLRDYLSNMSAPKLSVHVS